MRVSIANWRPSKIHSLKNKYYVVKKACYSDSYLPSRFCSKGAETKNIGEGAVLHDTSLFYCFLIHFIHYLERHRNLQQTRDGKNIL